MTRVSYSAIVSKNLIASIKKDAPKAPECPEKFEIVQFKLEISYRRGEENCVGIVFERAYVEHKLTKEIESFSISDHHHDLNMAASLFRRALNFLYPEASCWMTGSFAAGVDIHSSDLDFTVKIPGMDELNPFSKLMRMRDAFRRINGLHAKYVQKGFVPVLQMSHEATGVSIDVSIDNDASKRNTQLLCWYGQCDPRFLALCKVVKAWASKCRVEGASQGKLNSFSLCLMLIQYLQAGVQPAVLPNIQEIFEELNGEFQVKNDEYHSRNLREEITKRGSFNFDANESSLAALFLGFLKFYAEFDFGSKWISVKHGKVMEKRFDSDKKPMDGLPDIWQYIVVADPFLEIPRNCANTVRQTNYVERIQLEFQMEYERVLKNRTIFNLGPCNWSRMLTENGKKRDCQILLVDQKKEEENLKKAEDIPWGTPFEGEWTPRRPHPEVYWNQQFNYKRPIAVTPEWPVRYINMYSFLESAFE